MSKTQTNNAVNGYFAFIELIQKAKTFGGIALAVAAAGLVPRRGSSYGWYYDDDITAKMPAWQKVVYGAADSRVQALWPAYDQEAANAKAQALLGSKAKHYQDREDSFQRCDTDGFLSQWASDLAGQRDGRAAEIAADGGYAKFITLFDAATGEEVPAKLLEGQYGPYWLLTDRVSQKTGKPFVPAFKSRPATMQQHGVVEGIIVAPAIVVYKGEGTGLGGTCWVATVRVKEVR